MDETLTRVALDAVEPALPGLEGRVHRAPSSARWTPNCSRSGSRPSRKRPALTLHVENLYGENNHHIVEMLLQGRWRARCAQAIEIDPRRAGAVPSTKGTLGGSL